MLSETTGALSLSCPRSMVLVGSCAVARTVLASADSTATTWSSVGTGLSLNVPASTSVMSWMVPLSAEWQPTVAQPAPAAKSEARRSRRRFTPSLYHDFSRPLLFRLSAHELRFRQLGEGPAARDQLGEGARLDDATRLEHEDARGVA